MQPVLRAEAPGTNGEYALEVPPPGAYRIVVLLEGERFVEGIIVPEGREEIRRDIELRDR